METEVQRCELCHGGHGGHVHSLRRSRDSDAAHTVAVTAAHRAALIRNSRYRAEASKHRRGGSEATRRPALEEQASAAPGQLCTWEGGGEERRRNERRGSQQGMCTRSGREGVRRVRVCRERERGRERGREREGGRERGCPPCGGGSRESESLEDLRPNG